MTDKKPLILIADDEEDIKMLLSMYLENSGFDVVTAFDGLDTLARVKESNPDLILMDIMMPIIDGIEVTRRIKADEETAHIPVVMLTAAVKTNMVDKAMAAGAADYISKPFEPDRVKEIIDSILSEPPVNEESSETEEVAPEK